MLFDQEDINAIGGVVTAWGRFEHMFDGYLSELRANPSVFALENKVPGPFSKRARLFRRSAKLAFAKIPSFVSQVSEIVDRAIKFGTHRNRLMHGIIFERDSLNYDIDNTLIINIREKRVLRIYTATKEEIDSLHRDIIKASNDLNRVFFGWGSGDVANQYLTSSEREVLQNFHKIYLQPRHPPIDVKGQRRPPSFRS